MIFGIKTKKDKQIEKLEETNKALTEKISNMYLNHPHIITTEGNVISMGAIQILEEGMPSDYAKRMIAQKLVEEAQRFIHYDLEQHGTKNALKGYIQIVTYGIR